MANNGMPGFSAERVATPRDILMTIQGRQLGVTLGVISGSDARDSGNTGNLDVLRAGKVVSKDTVLKNDGKWKPTIVGVLTANADASAVSITVSAAQAVEINRRYGGAGTEEIYICDDVNIGSDEDMVVNAFEALTHSAINTSTGVITVSALVADYKAGAFIIASEAVKNTFDLGGNLELTPTTLIYSRYGIKVTDTDGTSIDVPFEKILVSGHINTAMIIDYPSNLGLARWLKRQLRNHTLGYVFSDDI